MKYLLLVSLGLLSLERFAAQQTFDAQNPFPDSCLDKTRKAKTTGLTYSATTAAKLDVTQIADVHACATACSKNKDSNAKALAGQTPEQVPLTTECKSFLWTPTPKACTIFAQDTKDTLTDASGTDQFGILTCATTTTSTSSTSSSSTSTTPTTTTGCEAMAFPENPFETMSEADQQKVCCEWAKQGECGKNKAFMLTQCYWACGSIGCTINDYNTCKWKQNPDCGGAPTTTKAASGQATPAPAQNSPGSGTGTDCQDSASQCTAWAAAGQCNANPYYMKVQCGKSCSSCGTTTAMLDAQMKDPRCPAADGDARCGFWSSIGECLSNPTWMMGNCASSCKSCPSTSGRK